MSFRRYEIILPKRYNDGSEIEPEKFLLTSRELTQRFGAVSFLPETFRGIWLREGREYQDENVRVFVDVEDTEENQSFFAEYKARLMERFKQLDLWIVSFEIRIT